MAARAGIEPRDHTHFNDFAHIVGASMPIVWRILCTAGRTNQTELADSGRKIAGSSTNGYECEEQDQSISKKDERELERCLDSALAVYHSEGAVD